MTTDTNAPCAREGCGEPPSWHSKKTTVETLNRDGDMATILVTKRDGACLQEMCRCEGYLAPEPERQAYVVEMPATTRTNVLVDEKWRFITPLADYLESHPQPAKPPIGDEVADLMNLTPSPATETVHLIEWKDGSWFSSTWTDKATLAESLAPEPSLCVCGGKLDEHGGDGRCSHVATWGTTWGAVLTRRCGCLEYRPAVQS